MPHDFPPATLALADGTTFHCRAFGSLQTATAEVVFNTSMTGYQEILSDPSYCGQFVVMTTPHIGNVGVNPDDMEAQMPWTAGLLLREVSRVSSSYRAQESLPDFLARHQIPGLTDLNTRTLVRHLRTRGAMMGTLSSDPALSEDDLVDIARRAPSMEGRDLVTEVSCPEPYHWQRGVDSGWYQADPTWPQFGQMTQTDRLSNQSPNRPHRVVAYDLGIKHNILCLLTQVGCEVTIVPASTSAAEALALKPDGIFLSNGPGDPAAVTYAVETVRELTETNLPLFGICLGHQILALALGGQTHKMKFGHRGGNQPVQFGGEAGPVAITSHNHGFAVSAGSLPDEVEVTHLNLNDHCIEGLRHTTKPIFSIQYHPEASPGPHDAIDLFEQFVHLMKQQQNL